MRKKPSILKDILFLAISSFVVVAAWIGFNLYHSHVTTTITPELQVQIVPINPDFDMVTLQALKSRKAVVPISELSAQAPVQPITAVAPTPQSTSPAINTPTPTIQQEVQPIISDIPITVQGQ